jgi:hypothetical protein
MLKKIPSIKKGLFTGILICSCIVLNAQFSGDLYSYTLARGQIDFTEIPESLDDKTPSLRIKKTGNNYIIININYEGAETGDTCVFTSLDKSTSTYITKTFNNTYNLYKVKQVSTDEYQCTYVYDIGIIEQAKKDTTANVLYSSFFTKSGFYNHFKKYAKESFTKEECLAYLAYEMKKIQALFIFSDFQKNNCTMGLLPSDELYDIYVEHIRNIRMEEWRPQYIIDKDFSVAGSVLALSKAVVEYADDPAFKAHEEKIEAMIKQYFKK